MEWLFCHRWLIEMIANIAVALGFIIASIVILINIRSLKLQRSSFQADLFHKISTEINKIVKEQKGVEEQGAEYIENWYERLIDAFEYFAFFANRKLLSKDMTKYYKEALILYCDKAAAHSKGLKSKLKAREENQLREIKEYYEKHRKGKAFPF